MIYIFALLAVVFMVGVPLWALREVRWIMNCTREEFDAYLGL